MARWHCETFLPHRILKPCAAPRLRVPTQTTEVTQISPCDIDVELILVLDTYIDFCSGNYYI